MARSLLFFFFAGRKRGKLTLPMRAERVPASCVLKLEPENVCLEAWAERSEKG